jgi:hypothetical protein
MKPDGAQDPLSPAVNHFVAADVAEILWARGWLDRPPDPGDAASPAADCAADPTNPTSAWLDRAAQLLGPHAPDREALASLLALIFTYDAPTLLRDPANQAALARAGAREVIRSLANQILEGGEIDSAHFKQIVDSLKATVPYRGPALFFPLRLALAGQLGDGALDRVILLLDSAANLPFAAPVKSTRRRILEFCAALD